MPDIHRYGYLCRGNVQTVYCIGCMDVYLAATAYVVGHQSEVTIRRDKAEDAVTLPLLVPHTGVEGDIIKQPDDGEDDTNILLKIIPGVHE